MPENGPQCDHPVAVRDKWRFAHFMAIAGMAIFLIGPIACFGAYAIGRDGDSAMGFALTFLGMGFFMVWSAAITDPGPDTASATTSGDRTASTPESPRLNHTSSDGGEG